MNMYAYTWEMCPYHSLYVACALNPRRELDNTTPFNSKYSNRYYNLLQIKDEFGVARLAW